MSLSLARQVYDCSNKKKSVASKKKRFKCRLQLHLSPQKLLRHRLSPQFLQSLLAKATMISVNLPSTICSGIDDQFWPNTSTQEILSLISCSIQLSVCSVSQHLGQHIFAQRRDIFCVGLDIAMELFEEFQCHFC